MDEVTKKKADRFRFLNRLYERTRGDELKLEDMWEIGDDLGLSRDETQLVTQYLIGERLAANRAIGGAIGITHYGVVEVERALSRPEASTQYFPPVVNILHVNTMVGSQIQQGSDGSSQSQTQSISLNDLAPIQALLASLQQDLSQLGLGRQELLEAQSELQTLKAQLNSPNPKRVILRESLTTLRTLVEGVAANGLSAGIVTQFGPALAALVA